MATQKQLTATTVISRQLAATAATTSTTAIAVAVDTDPKMDPICHVGTSS
jgi:hypothetical protein